MQGSKAADRPDVARYVAELRERGFVVVDKAARAADIADISGALDSRFQTTPVGDGDFSGRRTKRFGGILKRAPATRTFVMQPDVLAIADAVLGPACDRIQLNAAEAYEIGPGEAAQVPYRDEVLWPRLARRDELALTVIWPLAEAADAGGAVRVWPHSHAGAFDYPDTPVAPRLAPGDALLLLGSVLRGAGANRSAGIHRAVSVSYCLGWLKPCENPWLTYPPDIARGFDPALVALIGYRRDRPNLGGVDGDCPTRLLRGAGDEPVAARDALSEDQAAALAAYKEVQLAIEVYEQHES